MARTRIINTVVKQDIRGGSMESIHESMIMSWWIGMSREEFWAEVQRHEFKFSKMPSGDNERASWYATGRAAMAHRRELGYDMTFNHDMHINTSDPEVQSVWIDDPRIKQIEIDRAYAEWKRNAYTQWPPAILIAQTQACDWAAQIIVMLRLGYTPTDWDRHLFEGWCRDRHIEIQPMLDMVE